MRALAVFGIIFGLLFVLFAWWVDRHRTEHGAGSTEQGARSTE
jgi:hypothetical protein